MTKVFNRYSTDKKICGQRTQKRLLQYQSIRTYVMACAALTNSIYTMSSIQSEGRLRK